MKRETRPPWWAIVVMASPPIFGWSGLLVMVYIGQGNPNGWLNSVGAILLLLTFPSLLIAGAFLDAFYG